MKRPHALWRSRYSLGPFVLAVALPLAVAGARAGEWGTPPDPAAYTICRNVQSAESAADNGSAPTMSALTMPADDLPGADGQCGCSECGGDSGCGWYSSYWCADNLLCDNWAGRLAGCGIGADFELTQFYQGVASGGQEQNWEYGGKLDYFFNFEGQKMGLWEGLSAVMHAETRFGKDVNLDAVGLAPVNANMLYPSTFDEETAITGFLLNQALSEQLVVSAGKYNLFDLFEQLYPQTGRGIDGFMNVSSFAPLSVIRTLNLSAMGAGVMTLQEGQVQSAVSVMDTHNSTTTSGFDDLFDNGAVILGYYRLFHDWGGLPGSNAILGIYSSGTYTSLDPTTWAILPDTDTLVAGQETGSWNIEYFLDQKLWVDCCNPKRYLGLLMICGIADDNPSPVDWSATVAIQGQGLNARRPADSMGVAWFHTSLTSDFKQLVSPLFDLHDVTGVETYYNAAITPWFHLTGDLQVVEPAEINKDTALVLGVRANFAL